MRYLPSFLWRMIFHQDDKHFCLLCAYLDVYKPGPERRVNISWNIFRVICAFSSVIKVVWVKEFVNSVGNAFRVFSREPRPGWTFLLAACRIQWIIAAVWILSHLKLRNRSHDVLDITVEGQHQLTYFWYWKRKLEYNRKGTIIIAELQS